MKIEILEEAKQDLLAGFNFYEKQAQGLRSYFLDSLFPTLIHWFSMQASIRVFTVRTDVCRDDFPLRSITGLRTT
jgi:hypothetical protein